MSEGTRSGEPKRPRLSLGHHSEAVNLSLDGVVFALDRDTLRMAGEDSILRLLTGDPSRPTLPFKLSPEGCIMIPRSPKHFPTIVRYLRDGVDSFVVPAELREREEMLADAKYYGLGELVARLDRLKLRSYSVNSCHSSESGCVLKVTNPHEKIYAVLSVPSVDASLFCSARTAADFQGASVIALLENLVGQQSKDTLWRRQLTPILVTLKTSLDKSDKMNQDAFQIKFCLPEQQTTKHRALVPGQWMAFHNIVKVDSQEEIDNWLLSVGAWPLTFHESRPKGITMPPKDEASRKSLSQVYTLRLNTQDTLEIWPEPVTHSCELELVPNARVQFHLGAKLGKRYARAGLRICRNGDPQEAIVMWLDWGLTTPVNLTSHVVLEKLNGEDQLTAITACLCRPSTNYVAGNFAAKQIAVRKHGRRLFALVDGLDVTSCELQDESDATPQFLEFNFNVRARGSHAPCSVGFCSQ